MLLMRGKAFQVWHSATGQACRMESPHALQHSVARRTSLARLDWHSRSMQNNESIPFRNVPWTVGIPDYTMQRKKPDTWHTNQHHVNGSFHNKKRTENKRSKFVSTKTIMQGLKSIILLKHH